MEAFVDNRNGGAESFTFQALNTEEQSLYTLTQKKLRKRRQCSHCGAYYTLGGTVGNTELCGTREYYPDRDHFDWSTEAASEHHSLTLPLPVFFALQNAGELWHLNTATVDVGRCDATIQRKT